MKQQSQIVTTAPLITFTLAVKINSYKVDPPITEHLFTIFIILCASFWVIYNIMGALPQALKWSLNCKRKRIMKKKKNKNKLSNLQNKFFFSLSL
jgi:hypothetical protein